MPYCAGHTVEWMNMYNAADFHDFVDVTKLMMAFELRQITDKHIYPALPTAEDVYEALRANE